MFDVRCLRFDFQRKVASGFLTTAAKIVICGAMINVTQNAARQLRSLLGAQKQNRGLRVQISKGGCSGLHYEMTLDEKKSGDEVIERDGVEFFVDPESAAYLQGATLDYRDGLTASGFQITNPNASRTCGCGTSFEAAKETMPVRPGH